MKEFNQLSGPWTGMSIQGGRRLSEGIQLTIRDGRLWGEGTDVDGDFRLEGAYDPSSQVVRIVRRYTRTNRPYENPSWAAFDYEGTWDGTMVSGAWTERAYVENGGPFEMWPNREEDRLALAIEFEELLATR